MSSGAWVTMRMFCPLSRALTRIAPLGWEEPPDAPCPWKSGYSAMVMSTAVMSVSVLASPFNCLVVEVAGTSNLPNNALNRLCKTDLDGHFWEANLE